MSSYKGVFHLQTDVPARSFVTTESTVGNRGLPLTQTALQHVRIHLNQRYMAQGGEKGMRPSGQPVLLHLKSAVKDNK